MNKYKEKMAIIIKFANILKANVISDIDGCFEFWIKLVSILTQDIFTILKKFQCLTLPISYVLHTLLYVMLYIKSF